MQFVVSFIREELEQHNDDDAKVIRVVKTMRPFVTISAEDRYEALEKTKEFLKEYKLSLDKNWTSFGNGDGWSFTLYSDLFGEIGKGEMLLVKSVRNASEGN